jgi:hypothetical protein
MPMQWRSAIPVFWLPGASMMQGRDAIRAGQADFFAGSAISSVKLVETGKITHEDEASSRGSFTVASASRQDGGEATEVGRYADVSRKIDGRWAYLVDHAADDPPSAPARWNRSHRFAC